MNIYISVIKKARGTRKLLLSVVFLYLLHGFLGKTFHLPTFYSYILEFCSLLIWFRNPFNLKETKLHLIFLIFCIMISIDLLRDIILLVKPMNVLMGIRGFILPMALMFAAASYLKIQDYKLIFSILYKFQWLNVLCTFVQWKVYGLESDFNNGALMGGAEQNFFCISLIVYYLFAYTNKQSSLKKLLFVLGTSFFIAIIQDEKFIFVGAMLTALFYFLTQRLRFRNVLGAITLIVGIFLAVKSMGEGQTAAMGSINNAVEYSKKTGDGYGFPRIGSSVQISEMFFQSDVQYLFGLGLGTCTEMKAPGVDLDFSNQFGHLGYHLFVFQDVFLETGWVGAIFYIAFFVGLFFYNLKVRRSAPKEYKWLYNVSSTLALVSILIIWYNSTLRIYYAILPYILLGLGPCLTKNLNTNKK